MYIIPGSSEKFIELFILIIFYITLCFSVTVLFKFIGISSDSPSCFNHVYVFFG